MVISDRIIIGRRTAYACCAAQFDADATEARLYPNPHCKCDWKKKQNLAYAYAWAARIMRETPLSTETDCVGKCVSHEFACKVIQKFDPKCVKCGCGDSPTTCDITPDVTVYQAADADQQTVIPNVAGQQTLIISNANGVSNGWSSHVGQIATNDGSGAFTYTTPVSGTVVYAALTNNYFVAYTGGAGPYFPIVDGSLTGFTLTLLSRNPAIALLYSREVLVETSPDNITWTARYSGPESVLAYGYVVPGNVTDSPLYARVTYFYGSELDCQAGPFTGTIPPYVSPPCGILQYTATPTGVCGTNTWRINFATTQIDGWQIGTVTPSVNGVAQTPVPIVLGNTVLGPYNSGEVVTLSIVNNLDGACDIAAGPYRDPRLVAVNFTVLQAVDANFQGSATPGQLYLIVSNVDGLTGGWADHVGEIGNTTPVYTTVPNGQVVFATNPGTVLGYWQMDSGTIRQVYPQPTFTWNTVTEVWLATLPTLPPATAGSNIFIQARCNGLVISPSVYNGPGGAFSPTSFPSTPCGFAGVTGTVVYNQGCPFIVDVLIESYTPTGDPDTSFFAGGVDGLVRDVLPLEDGSYVVVGSFTQFDPGGTPVVANRVLKLNQDGTLDTAFNANANGAGGLDDRADVVVKDSAGKLYIGGWFTSFNGASANRIVSLNPDGTRNTAFVVGTGFNSVVVDVEVDSHDNIMVSGVFSQYKGSSVGRIVRLLPNGTIDIGFNAGSGFNGSAGHMVIDGTDVLVNSGQPSFNAYNGTNVLNATADKTLVRVGADGVLNGVVAQGTQFQEPAPPTSNEFTVQPDRQIICVGSFNDYNGIPVGRLIRLDPVGTPDATFLANIGTGLSGESNSADVMPNNQIMVGCVNTATFNGAPSGGLVRLNPDGTHDLTFNIGTGFNSSVYVVRKDYLGRLLVGGAFTSLNGVSRLRICRLS